MAEKYEKSFVLPHMLYADGAPIVISAGALLSDNAAKRKLVQLQFISISDKKLKSVRVSITPLSVLGEALGENVSYVYDNLAIARDGTFGKKAAIVLPVDDVCGFKLAVPEVVYDDQSTWDGTGAVWAALKKPQTLAEGLGSKDMAHQYVIRYGSDCTTMPMEDRELWVCACGTFNREQETKCHHCRRVYSALKNVNISSLRTESAQRVEAEKQQDETEKTEKKANTKKLVIALAVLIPVLIIAVVFMMTVPRQMQIKADYETAQTLLAEGKYDEAESAFIALGDYEDSALIAAQKIPYERAMYLMECAKNDDVAGLLSIGMKRSDVAEGESVGVALYREAAERFAALGNYKDSAALCAEANDAISEYFDVQKKDAYDQAAALLTAGRYLEARDAFAALGNYKDCAEMVNESMYLRAVALCDVVEKYFMQGVTANFSNTAGEKSVIYIPQSSFSTLGNGVSSDLRDILREDGAEINIADSPEDGVKPICEAVADQFAALGDYKDSKEQIERAEIAGDFTRPFYTKCAVGDLVGAYQWLSDYAGEFEMREQWLTLLQKYAVYCNSWELYAGDSTLISQTYGMSVQCGAFTSKVIIENDTPRLVIYPNGAEDYPLELAVAVGTDGFYVSPDGVNTYYAVISNFGRFTYTRYNSLGLQSGTQSCEYSPVG